MVIELKHLTFKQRQAYHMRFHRGWRMRRIAVALGITVPSVSRLLRRAVRSAGLPCRPNLRVILIKPRPTRLMSLARAWRDLGTRTGAVLSLSRGCQMLRAVRE